MAPGGATWRHRWYHIEPQGGATFFLCLQTIQQSTDRVVPPDTSMVCGADKGLLSLHFIKVREVLEVSNLIILGYSKI